jgi:hypothetical protein
MSLRGRAELRGTSSGSRVGIRAGQSDSPTRVRPRFLVLGRVRTQRSVHDLGPGSGSVSRISNLGRIGLILRFTR